jgi:hypothetical protein
MRVVVDASFAIEAYLESGWKSARIIASRGDFVSAFTWMSAAT